MRDTFGFAGAFGVPSAARHVARGLLALADRGGEVCGVVAIEAGRARVRRSPGVGWLADEPALDALIGEVALGVTVRVDDDPAAREMAVGLLDPPTLPAVGFLPDGPVAVLVVGGLLAVPDVVAAAPSASEAVLELVRRSAQRTAVNRFVDALGLVRGGFVAVMVTGDRLVVAADASGVRGAVVARLGGGHVVASDLRALPEGSFAARAVLPGEVVVVDAEGASALRPFARRPEAACLMEAMCAAQPDERVGRRSAEAWRRELGVLLARHGMPDDASVVAAAEPAAEAVALAFASVVGAPLEPLVGADRRASAARVAGRGVVLISASGGESAAVDALLRAGASTVHVRRARPDLTARCPFGFRPVDGDPPSAAASDRALRLDELAPLLGAGGWCDACVGGIAPWSTESADVQLPLFRGA